MRSSSLLIPFLILLLIGSATGDSSSDLLHIDSSYIRTISALSPLVRDKRMDQLKNRMIFASGTIQSKETIERYDRPVLLKITDTNHRTGVTLIYYLFMSIQQDPDLLASGDSFEFRGQCMKITASSAHRSEYILDVILEEGALTID